MRFGHFRRIKPLFGLSVSRTSRRNCGCAAEWKAGSRISYIANTVDVGDSEQVHGYSNQFFAAKGRPANEVFSEFLPLSMMLC